MTDLINIVPMAWARLILTLFFSILFLQSGFDKIYDWNGNLEWLKGHFGKSPLRGQVPMMLGTTAILESLTGVISAVGVFGLLFLNQDSYAIAGHVLSGISLLALFFGQRIAKDYAGAAALVPYFLMVVLGLFVFSH